MTGRKKRPQSGAKVLLDFIAAHRYNKSVKTQKR